MSFLTISRRLSSSIRLRPPKFSLTKSLSSSSADQYWIHLRKHESNIEKTLNTVKAKLDPLCVNEVVQRCATDKPHLGLRFFIWAGLQPSYRHSSYMYGKACNFLRISRNPRLISDVIEAYKNEGCMVSVKMFKVVLSLCKEAKLANEGLWVLRKMKEFNCRPDTMAYNVVIRLFCEKGCVDEAVELMREMGLIGLSPDMVTFMAMVKGFCDVGRLEDACGLFKIMREHGCPPNAVAYSALLDGLCRFGSLDRALELLAEMEKEGGDCKPNVVTYTSMIQSFCEKGHAMEALSILDRMEACQCAPNRTTFAVLIMGLCKAGHIDEAYTLIDKVAGGSVSYSELYSSLVLSLLKIERLEEAEKVFKMMLASEMQPDGSSSSTLMKRLCSVGRVLDAYFFYDQMEKLGCLPSIDSDIYSILLAGLCEERNLVEAEKLARLMVDKGVQLKTPYVDDIVKGLKSSAVKEIVSCINMMERQ